MFDIETTVDPVAIHRRIGYIPGEFALYDRLTGGQTIEYFAQPARRRRRALPGDASIERLDIDPSRKFKEYSKGNKQKVGLVIALQHRPELLILDEPTSGLDPLVQQTFYELVREAKAEGRTVFLSSHILSEVEKTCDRVAIIRDGRLVKVDRVEALRDLAHHQVELRFAGRRPDRRVRGPARASSDVSVEDHTLRMRVSGPITPVVQAAARYELLDFVSREPSLEETFLAQYGTAPTEARSPAWLMTAASRRGDASARRRPGRQPDLRPRLGLRQDAPRLAARDDHRVRPDRRLPALERRRVRRGLHHARVAPRAPSLVNSLPPVDGRRVRQPVPGQRSRRSAARSPGRRPRRSA